ncbi:glyoxylase-like metal-dependent hydrolase (beta-lactamase superfamily II) [Pelomonas saccharophila]|uniref:Glyoxylase-like metal-dependent hydrolase (Beta-lactamase superfamily II) n=1 Tax=Roseateles saccharophilus TaxID=304 RepID=A0ABU1YTC5_ROSSA|nr:MBL fold metallo-hydrolase [Roseateles saccharophilus]MDR7272114.1 glyoxylase-like metal-dependent hydrolase (beta-lactamase superfamily II) [Roseateles saccharophilus]
MRLLLITLSLCCAAVQAQQTLAPGVLLVPGGFEAGRQPDGNSLLLKGSAGWLLIDSGRHRAHTEAALKAAGGQVRAVLNTHWHLDHLGGNAWLRSQQPGVEVWASPAVAQALATDGWLDRYRRQLAEALPTAPAEQAAVMRVDQDLLDQAAALRPDHEVKAAGPLTLAGRRLQVGVETAVSGGDLWVLDTASGLLAVGDLVTLPVPFMDTACPPAWREALARISAQPFKQLVPGHGPVMSRADFERWRSGYEALLDCADQGLHPAACAAVWRSRVDSWLDDAGRARVSGMLGYYFKTLLQAPKDQRERFCRRP